MRYKIDKHSLMFIVIFSVIHLLFSLYYAYFCLGNNFMEQEQFLKVLIGGIRIEDSGNLFCVTLNILPKGLFCVYVANFFMKELKTNFLYIFLRTKKRERWLRGVMVKTLFSAFCYEVIFGIVVLGLKIFMANIIHFSEKEFLLMFVMESLQLFMLALFSNVMLLFVSETAGIFGTFLELGVPILFTGVVYENNGVWEYPAKWIPFNLGNYNYMSLSNMNPVVIVLVIAVLCIVMYIIAMKRLNKYELI